MRGDARKKAADIHGIRMRGEVKVWIGVGSDQIRSVVGGIGDGDGERVGCGKRRIVSRIKWYPSLSVSSPCRSFSLLHPLRSARLSLFHPLASSPSLLLAPRGWKPCVWRMYDFACHNLWVCLCANVHRHGYSFDGSDSVVGNK